MIKSQISTLRLYAQGGNTSEGMIEKLNIITKAVLEKLSDDDFKLMNQIITPITDSSANSQDLMLHCDQLCSLIDDRNLEESK